jgi:hypothetical protein
MIFSILLSNGENDSYRRMIYSAYSDPTNFAAKYKTPRNISIVFNSILEPFSNRGFAINYIMTIHHLILSMRLNSIMRNIKVNDSIELFLETATNIQGTKHLGIVERRNISILYKINDHQSKIIVMEFRTVNNGGLTQLANQMMSDKDIEVMQTIYKNSSILKGEL